MNHRVFSYLAFVLLVLFGLSLTFPKDDSLAILSLALFMLGSLTLMLFIGLQDGEPGEKCGPRGFFSMSVVSIAIGTIAARATEELSRLLVRKNRQRLSSGKTDQEFDESPDISPADRVHKANRKNH